MSDFNPDEVPETIEEMDVPTPEVHDEPMPEAPASATVRVWIKGYGVMFTMRAMSNGRDAAIKLAERIEKFVDHAESKGWKNKWDEPVVPQATKVDPNAPTCGIHGTKMIWRTGIYKQDTKWSKAGESYAFWSCPSINVDGSRCKYKPPKEGQNDF